MKKVFSLALLFASVNNFFADGDTSNEPVAESKNVVLDEQQNSVSASEKFFLELGVNVGSKNSSITNKRTSNTEHFSYHFAFGGTIAPYYVINDKYSVGLELGINREENAKLKSGESKFNFTHYSYMIVLKRDLCNSMYAKFGAGVANGSLLVEDGCNVLRMGPTVKVSVGYNVWKNVDVELGYNYYRINAKKLSERYHETFSHRATSHAISAGVLVRL